MSLTLHAVNWRPSNLDYASEALTTSGLAPRSLQSIYGHLFQVSIPFIFPFILFSEKVSASLSDLSKTQSASVDSKGREKGDNRNLCLRELG